MSHAGVAFVDKCLTGFLKLEGLRSTMDPEGWASMTHTGGAACLCQSNTEGPPLLLLLLPFFPLCDLDKLSNVNTDGVWPLTASALLSFRDLKIENLLLDEQDNIKLIGKRSFSLLTTRVIEDIFLYIS